MHADGKELIAPADGYHESAESWANLLPDCARQGMHPRCRPSAMGHLGFWPRYGRCSRDQGGPVLVLQTANVLAVLPKSAHQGAKKALAEIWGAEDKDHARRAVETNLQELER